MLSDKPLITPSTASATSGEPEVLPYPPEYTVAPEINVVLDEKVLALAIPPTGCTNPSGFFIYNSYLFSPPVPLLAYKAVCPNGGVAIFPGFSVKSLMYDGIFFVF